MTTKKSPQIAAEAEIARFQAKLDNAPEGSRLAANMTLRIAITKASLIKDKVQRDAAENAARQTHAETIKAIEEAQAG